MPDIRHNSQPLRPFPNPAFKPFARHNRLILDLQHENERLRLEVRQLRHQLDVATNDAKEVELGLRRLVGKVPDFRPFLPSEWTGEEPSMRLFSGTRWSRDPVLDGIHEAEEGHKLAELAEARKAAATAQWMRDLRTAKVEFAKEWRNEGMPRDDVAAQLEEVEEGHGYIFDSLEEDIDRLYGGEAHSVIVGHGNSRSDWLGCKHEFSLRFMHVELKIVCLQPWRETWLVSANWQLLTRQLALPTRQLADPN